MKHVVRHDLELGLAKKAAERALEAYSNRFHEHGPTVCWNGEKADIRFAVKGITLCGSVEVDAHTFALSLDVPLLFRVFRKKAIDIIETEIKRWIERAKRGEL
jgi:hypothetical protein